MRIGELARRLRVSTRTLRHYESLGLLRPPHVDEVNGYRVYGQDELLRGVRIEQLKAAGFGLGEIGEVLDGAAPLRAALERRRGTVNGIIDDHRRQLSVIDALARAGGALAGVELARVPATDVVVRRCTSTPDALATTIRREVQRLRRRLKVDDPGGAWTFVARFPLDLDVDELEVDVAAVLAAPLAGACTWPATTRLETTIVGPPALLPVAYDAVLSAAAQPDLVTTGMVWETYHDLSRVARTTVSLVVEERGLPSR